MSAAASLRVQSGRLPLCVLHSGSFCALPQFQHVVDVAARWGGRTHTAWLPLGDVPVSHGAMMICEGAHAGGDARFQKLRRDYLLGRRRSGTRESGNGTDNGWLTNDCAEVLRECGGGRWLTADMRAGDVVILPLETLHCTAQNISDCHRISCDVRWMPVPQQAEEQGEKEGRGVSRKRRRR